MVKNRFLLSTASFKKWPHFSLHDSHLLGQKLPSNGPAIETKNGQLAISSLELEFLFFKTLLRKETIHQAELIK